MSTLSASAKRVHILATGDETDAGCIDFEELCRRARTLSGRYNSEIEERQALNDLSADSVTRPSFLPRWQTYAGGERVLYHDNDQMQGHEVPDVARAVNSHKEAGRLVPNASKIVDFPATESIDEKPHQPPKTISSPSTATTSPGSRGWWDILKSPFFVVTPVSGGSASGEKSLVTSPSTGPGDVHKSTRPYISVPEPAPVTPSESLPVRLVPGVLSRKPVPTCADGRRMKLPAFVAVVMEANKLERERLGAITEAGAKSCFDTLSPLLGEVLSQEDNMHLKAIPDERPLQLEPSMLDYFSIKPSADQIPLRPPLPRGSQTLPARLGKAVKLEATAVRPRKEIESTSFLQAVLDLDKKEKEEKKLKVKRKKKTFAEEEDEWEFKCCGVDGSDEYFAACIDDGQAEKTMQEEKRELRVTSTEVRRRPTVKELRSGSSTTIVGHEGQEDGSVGKGSGRRKLVRWWTNLS